MTDLPLPPLGLVGSTLVSPHYYSGEASFPPPHRAALESPSLVYIDLHYKYMFPVFILLFFRLPLLSKISTILEYGGEVAPRGGNIFEHLFT